MPFLTLRPLAGALLVLVLASQAGAADTPLELDIILRGGTIYTGDSNRPVVGDVGIAGDRIVFAGQPAQGRQFTARRVIDVRGQVVAPGFIDAHTHADRELFTDDTKAR